MKVSHDFWNFLLLLLLYTLQGVPMGLSASIPFLLQGHVSYSQIATFSLSSIPFSLKLLWAPIVDCLYWPSFGRRKSWLVPVQLSCGVLMIWASYAGIVSFWFDISNVSRPRINALTWYFTVLYILMATQDIAVDGWALTMLSEQNVGWASTANTIGQQLGFFLSHIGFLALNDPNTCNKLFRRTPSDEGMVNLETFMCGAGWVMIGTTILIIFLKHESDDFADKTHKKKSVLESHGEALRAWKDEPVPVPISPLTKDKVVMRPFEILKSTSSQRRDVPHLVDNTSDHAAVLTLKSFQKKDVILNSYKSLVKIMRNSNMQMLVVVLMTCRIPFATLDSAMQFKMMEAGMKKEELAFFGPFFVPLGLVVPMLIGRLSAVYKPMNVFLIGIVFRMIMTLACLVLLPYVPNVYQALGPDESPSFRFYCLVFIFMSLYNVGCDLMFVSQMAFFAMISDSSMGGTYMTFLNTLANMGNKWPSYVSLSLLDYMTERDCTGMPNGVLSAHECPILHDGFYKQCMGGIVYGCVWLMFMKRRVQRLGVAAHN